MRKMLNQVAVESSSRPSLCDAMKSGACHEITVVQLIHLDYANED